MRSKVVIEARFCIPMDYEECLSYQRNLNEMRNNEKIPDTIIVTEHPDTYTAGIHFKEGNEKNYSVPIIRVERGGALTYHGKGQIVFYFIFKIKERNMNIKDFIIRIQEAVKKTLESFGVQSEGRLFKETGVWTNGRKICSIGLALKGFSTLHGIAININTDLTKFYKINPCDFDASIMTSLEKEIGKKVSIDDFTSKFLDNFSLQMSDSISRRNCI